MINGGDQGRFSFSLVMRSSLFLLSAATLIFEINLSRLFSVSQFYHFAFMIVSLALLGFGASGTFLAILPNIGRQNPQRTLSILAISTSLSILFSYILINLIPLDSFSIAWDYRQALILLVHYIALALPFFFSGVVVGLLLERFPKSAGTVYGTNLVGSALGCLGALLFPIFVGGEGTVLLSSGLAALAGLIPGIAQLRKSVPQRAATLLAGVILIFHLYALSLQISTHSSLPLLDLRLSPYKSLSYALQVPGAETISQRWNAFSRVDVVRSTGIRSIPGMSFRYLSPLPAEDGLFIDGDNLNPVIQPGADLEFTSYLLQALAFELRPAASVLVLEPGGGLNLLTALHQGADHVTAVEANSLVVEAAQPIYELPKLNTYYETGRSFLRRSQEQFDLILFPPPDSYHPVRSGAYSLAEDYRFTLEAYHDALDRLEEGGILVITRWLQIPPSEWLRSFILAVIALENAHLDPGLCLAAVRSFNTGLLLIKRSPYTQFELDTIRSFSAKRAFDLAYLPDLQPEETNRFNILEEPMYYQTFSGFLSASSRQNWLDEYTYDVSPPTDNHPFFGHYFKWSQARQIIAELGKTWQPFGGAGYFVLFVLLALALMMAFGIILLPLIFAHRPVPPRRLAPASFAYFGLIGLAFFLVEIPLIQHFILYLGHPTYALTAALFTILLFSGIGSQNSYRFSNRNSLILLIFAILIIPWLLPLLFELTLGYPFALRMFITILVLAPLGFLMGIPFPSGIRALETAGPERIPWAWGVNGALSVISSILAALITLSAGFSWSFLVGALGYVGAWAAKPHLKR